MTLDASTERLNTSEERPNLHILKQSSSSNDLSRNKSVLDHKLSNRLESVRFTSQMNRKPIRWRDHNDYLIQLSKGNKLKKPPHKYTALEND